MESLNPILRRRTWLKLAGLSGASWLTPLAQALAAESEGKSRQETAQSVILLWLAGGPSQLETFDPHPGKRISAGTKAIATAVPGIKLAAGYERLAEQMQSVALVRSLVSKEGDHERGTYLVKTGYRPDTTVVHPSLGAICWHQLPEGDAKIPRHISILPNQWPGRGGMLGNEYDAFKTYDPKYKVPDVTATVSEDRQKRRLADLEQVEKSFARGRAKQARETLHPLLVSRAATMMTTEQLKAFEVTEESAELRERYGDTPFGRGCLAARRLIEQGVRCVEVTLEGWDSHAKNHEIHANNAKVLDAALSALLADLRERGTLDKTIVICAGEFGRTPQLNGLEGRDHWPNGFTCLLAGGRLRGGQVIGATDPEGGKQVQDPKEVADIHATVLTALGIDPQHEEISPAGRPIMLSSGKAIPALLA